ncbi:TPA: DUF2442 domain-containing protein [Candidatus Poribacteria bacterium]|nr:DUF2442 domain-containing protein [Candidatus Poribacteria bacterium]
MHFVRNASYISEYKLLITFEDKTVKLIDLKSHLDGRIFEPLKNINYFKTFRVDPEIDTIVWENGADFSPDFLYEIGIDFNISEDMKNEKGIEYILKSIF